MSDKKKWTITLDTCCIIAGKGDPHVKQLFEWHDQGIIEVVKTDVVDTELKSPSSLRRSSKYREDMGVLVMRHSRVGRCLVAGDEDVQRGNTVQNILFPGEPREKLGGRQIRDIMALATHQKYRADFFVTLDKQHILSKRQALKGELGVEVLSPDECVKLVRRQRGGSNH
jgi:hypothetical protein